METGNDMNGIIQLSVLAALFCAGVSGCQQAGKDAGKDTLQSQVQAPAESAMKSAEPAPESATVAAPPASPTPQVQTKAATSPKTKSGQAAQPSAAPKTAPTAAAVAAARADSIKQAQQKAEAARVARLDSVKRADAAKAAAKSEPVVPRAEPVAAGGAALAAQGKEPYEANCRKCHGVRGVPPKSMQAKFPKIAAFDAAFFARRSDDSVVTVLTKGKNADMKSFKDKLTHAQMVAVAAYIRSLAQ
jgi:mono/diheme cytochrome c family protein